MAMGVGGRGLMDGMIPNLQNLADQVKKAQSVRDDTQVANLLRLAMLQTAQTFTTLISSYNQLLGSSYAFNLGEISGGTFTSSATPFTSTPAAAPAPVAAQSDADITQVSNAVAAAEQALNQHNAISAAIDMADGANGVATVQNFIAGTQNTANGAYSAFQNAVAAYYQDAAGVAQTIFAAAAGAVPGDCPAGAVAAACIWPDTNARLAQESAAIQRIAATIANTPETYGRINCNAASATVYNGRGVAQQTLSGCQAAAQNIANTLYPALELLRQAQWYLTFAPDNGWAGQSLASELQTLGQSAALNLSDLNAASQAANDNLAAALAQVDAAQQLQALSPSDTQTLAALAKSLTTAAADAAFAYYVPYNLSIAPPVPTGTALNAVMINQP